MCICILDRPVYTCAYTCAFAFMAPPDVTEVGCTVPTSGYHQPSAPLGNLSDGNASAQNHNYKTGFSW